jgi:hypothetical protein
VQSLWKSIWKFSKKLKIEVPKDPAIQLLGMYLKECKSAYNKDTFTPMFIAAVFTIAKVCNQHRCLLVNEWIKKIWYMDKMKYYLAIKKVKLCNLQEN